MIFMFILFLELLVKFLSMLCFIQKSSTWLSMILLLNIKRRNGLHRFSFHHWNWNISCLPKRPHFFFLSFFGRNSNSGQGALNPPSPLPQVKTDVLKILLNFDENSSNTASLCLSGVGFWNVIWENSVWRGIFLSWVFSQPVLAFINIVC